MLVAVLLDRRALTVRNVAVAAMIILVLRPESILTASFQMSFAATLALVAGFEFFSERRRERLALGPPPRRTARRIGLVWLGGLALTSLLAGLATAPFGAFHFHRTAPLSLLANVVAAPVVTFLVMYPALFAVILMPLGLEAAPFRLMDIGIDLVVAIGRWIDAWTGDGGRIAAAPLWALLAVVTGMLWLSLWREKWRLLGVAPVIIGLAAWGSAPRPAIMVDETGSVAAVRGEDGRYHVAGDGADFEVDTWLRADGDLRAAGDASLAADILCDRIGCTAPLPGGARLALLADARGFAEDCRNAAVLVTAHAAPEGCDRTAFVIDGPELARTGAQALYRQADGSWRSVTVRPEVRRSWMPPLPDQ
ncbi:MAG: ComEC/Rec2 family competence protein [Bauldia sp.]|nr:ComEC/Rec2 family competence protein [Bauldia sp.]